MSRYNCTDYILGASVVDDNGDTSLIGELKSRYGLTISAYYELEGFFGSIYYQMADLTGYVSTPYGGSTTMKANVRITDANGGVKTMSMECDGWPRFMSCYMLLSIIPGKDAKSTEIDFQQVEELELKEAVGASYYDSWYSQNIARQVLVEIENPPFKA